MPSFSCYTLSFFNSRIGKDMLALGKFLGVKVLVIGGPSSAPTPTGAHVVVGTLHQVRSLLRRMELSTEYIQTVVVDEPVHMREHEIRHLFANVLEPWEDVPEPWEDVLEPLEDQIQISVFSETGQGVAADYVRGLLKDPVIIRKVPEELTVKGIIKNLVFSLKDENSKIGTLTDLFQAQNIIKTSVFFVNAFEMVATLAQALETLSSEKWKVLSTNLNMDQNSRDIINQELSLSNPPRVLITTDECTSGVDFQNVCFVVNYDLPTPRGKQDKYLHRMGRFRGVNAINFVTQIDWTMLFEIQNLYKGVVFEAHSLLEATGFISEANILKNEDLPETITHFFSEANILNNEELPETIKGIKHFLLNGDIFDFLDDLKELILKTKSVLFVPDPDVIWFAQRLHSLFDELNIFHDARTELSNFTRCKSPCVLFTSDIEAVFNGYPLEVPLVINYHLPLVTRFYDCRIACCKSDGAVVHFVSDYNWLKVLYIQSRYNCVLNRVRYDGAADLVEPYVTVD